MELTFRVLALVAPLLVGALCGGLRLFPKPDLAVAQLNRFALYVAFPALVYGGLADARFALPSAWLFWALVPATLLLALALLRTFGRPHAGSLALVVAFGNVAYIGLPVVQQLLGDAATGVGALAVAIHVTLAMVFGPALLLRWSGGDGSAPPSAVLRQPLLWAPLAGLLARQLPGDARRLLGAVADPLGDAAAPVARFLLGLYLHTHRAVLRRIDRAALGHVAAKLLLLPALTFAGVAGGLHAGLLPLREAQVLLLLAAMPTAITTFAIAERFGVGVNRVTQAIVASTLASALSLPATAWLALRVLPGWA